MDISDAQADRAWGTVLVSAAGDALGSQYEFGPSHADSFVPEFGVGVFKHERGEWTDDTSMAIPVLEWVGARGEKPLKSILQSWILWSQDAKDVGNQTRAILSKLNVNSETLQHDALALSERTHERSYGKSAGNGSLMRIGPYALNGLGEELDLTTLREIIQWTHFEENNFIACSLWIDSIRQAIVTGDFSMNESLKRLGYDKDETWKAVVDKALAPETHPRDYKERNGWVVAAFAGALSAVAHSSSAEDALYRAIRGGGDTDTVAAIAGALAGAVYGASSVPEEWNEILFGWPGYSLDELQALTLRSIF